MAEENLPEAMPKSDLRCYKGFTSVTPAVRGRREFLKYRDLGMKLVSKGIARAEKIDAIARMVEPTGWHYHVCDYQFVYCLKGTFVLEFEDGTVGTFVQGDCLIIPGGFRHNEVHLSEDVELLEFVVPGEMGTVKVDRPAHLPASLRPVDNANPD